MGVASNVTSHTWLNILAVVMLSQQQAWKEWQSRCRVQSSAMPLLFFETIAESLVDVQESQANPEDNMAPAEVASHVQRRVRRIAEQAFWDSVQATLAESTSGVTQQQVTGQLAGLLAHMGQELMTVLPEQATAAREQLAAELDESRLQEALTAHQVSHHHHYHSIMRGLHCLCNTHDNMRVIWQPCCAVPVAACAR